MPNHRIDRLSEQIKHAISHTIAQEIKDPDIPPMTTVMGVEVAGDLRHCKVAVSVLGDETTQKKALSALKRSSGFIRHALGRQVQMRYLPELHFTLDESVTHSLRIASLLRDMGEQDKEQEKRDE
jgi:ribosome-binding factor A